MFSTVRQGAVGNGIALSRRLVPRPNLVGRRSFHSTRRCADKDTTAVNSLQRKQQHEAYLRDANAKMAEYHNARELLRQGKLKSKNPRSSRRDPGSGQLAVVGVFIAAFITTPLIGKKIATDHEFREKYVPSWFDFTVKAPENPWTRDELHEQLLEVQRDIRQRAIDGDFAPDKLRAMQENLDRVDLPAAAGQKLVQKTPLEQEWDKIHPGLERGEDVNED